MYMHVVLLILHMWDDLRRMEGWKRTLIIIIIIIDINISIPRVWKSNPSKEAQQLHNNGKNRYSDILPYDNNRVRLVSNGGKPGSDYINASYINGYKESKKYICAQGPMEETAAEFWTMIWEQKTAVIIMVTRCIEGGKNKCYQYWPRQKGKKLEFKSLSVTNNEVMLYPDYIITKISLNHGGNSRIITHVQFTKWPDHGVPDDPDLLLRLRRRVLSFCNFFDGPMVVHCSAGVGRSGTFIAISSLMEMLEDEGRIDVYGFVVSLRQQRCLMVQVEDQYILIHQVLLEHQLYGDTEISLAELRTMLPSLLMKESETEPSSLELEFQVCISREVPLVVNPEITRVKLKKMEVYTDHESDCEDDDESDDEDEDYINASYLNGYHALGTFIATQGPLQNTLAHFWHMVFQKDCHNIVMLTELTEGGVEQCYQYWPEKDAQTYGEVEVQLVETEKPNEELTVRRFNIKHKQQVALIAKYFQEIFVCQVLLCWEYRAILILILTFSSDGAERTGTFCALWNILESGRMEGMVDVFQTVKKLRLQRPAMIKTLVSESKALHTVVKVIKVQNGVPASTASKQSPDTKTDEVVLEMDDVPDVTNKKQENNAGPSSSLTSKCI
uniref:Tyrosine-protein phosphatase non-receptor type 20 n=1 Tax=Eptatretus burgeri TaxID=7764 RepID=A0A8C4QB64_EPTBU